MMRFARDGRGEKERGWTHDRSTGKYSGSVAKKGEQNGILISKWGGEEKCRKCTEDTADPIKSYLGREKHGGRRGGGKD